MTICETVDLHGPASSETSNDERAIRWLIERWAVWRDSADWQRFATLWHPDARMVATFFDGSATAFVDLCRAGWERGLNVTHHLGGTAVDIADSRAVAQTRMTIVQRVVVHDVLVDAICSGRFYDLLERRDGKWRLSLRRCIYENDRLLPVEPGRSIPFDRSLLDSFPEGYRHLAYVQTLAGMTVAANLPGRVGSELEKLYAHGEAWLAGTATSGTAS